MSVKRFLPVGRRCAANVLLLLQVPDAGGYGDAQMQQAAPRNASAAMGTAVSAAQGEPDASLTALLVDPSLSEPLQVVLFP